MRRLNPATGLWNIKPQWVVTPGKQTNKLLLTAIELSLGGSRPYTSTDKTNKNKYT
jgi:hypothetical protein